MITGCRYFEDLELIAGDIYPRCRAQIDQRFSNVYSLQLVIAGSMRFGYNGGPLTTLDRPAVFWHWPHDTYQYHAAAGGTWHHAWVSFRGRRAERLIRSGFAVLAADRVAFLRHPGPVRSAFRRLVALAHDRQHARASEAVGLLETILDALVRDREAAAQARPYADAIQAVVDEVRLHPFRRADFAALASDHGLSYSHFRRLFRSYVGQAPRSFAERCRMEEVARRLRAPGVLVKQVARLAGFDDASLFSKAFRRHIGLSPNEYRQSVPARGERPY
ncbi:MAG TPA: helix-turn-helix domain-containing protein [Tepidisphaeraceae bacterium]|nr:helix-turn-helix domain-containing protein [Tepidisphaeraceae bacterium]